MESIRHDPRNGLDFPRFFTTKPRERLTVCGSAASASESAAAAGSATYSLDTSRHDTAKDASKEKQNQTTDTPRQRRKQNCSDHTGPAVYRGADVPDQRNRSRQLENADHDRNGTGAPKENHCQSPVIHGPMRHRTS